MILSTEKVVFLNHHWSSLSYLRHSVLLLLSQRWLLDLEELVLGSFPAGAVGLALPSNQGLFLCELERLLCRALHLVLGHSLALQCLKALLR